MIFAKRPWFYMRSSAFRWLEIECPRVVVGCAALFVVTGRNVQTFGQYFKHVGALSERRALWALLTQNVESNQLANIICWCNVRWRHSSRNAENKSNRLPILCVANTETITKQAARARISFVFCSIYISCRNPAPVWKQTLINWKQASTCI